MNRAEIVAGLTATLMAGEIAHGEARSIEDGNRASRLISYLDLAEQILEGGEGRARFHAAEAAESSAPSPTPGGLRDGRPEVVCLCGSTRFMEAFFDEGWRLTLEGKIVLSVGVCKHVDAEGGHGAEAIGPEVADQLDELHLRKIDMADSVRILNVGGYIGESTRKELDYAKSLGKPISYLEPEAALAAPVAAGEEDCLKHGGVSMEGPRCAKCKKSVDKDAALHPFVCDTCQPTPATAGLVEMVRMLIDEVTKHNEDAETQCEGCAEAVNETRAALRRDKPVAIATQEVVRHAARFMRGDEDGARLADALTKLEKLEKG